ncbi:DUF6691 family protein [Anaerolentibacter hominis]|uniref:DUF6691 family protein n=1 Tax=Anaerolentibacter hominis TaxID=3079009 RepID=UPI0031B7F726
MNIILAIILGSLFGFALYLTGASHPVKLVSMLRLRDLSLMKIILFAIGLSSVLLFAANALGIFDLSHLSIKTANLGVLAGGLIFGVGFGWIGSCPGTCVAASGGGGIRKALITVLGGLAGAFTFSITYGFWKSLGLFGTMDLGKMTLFTLSEKYPALLGLGFSGLLITGVLFMTLAVLLPANARKAKQ